MVVDLGNVTDSGLESVAESGCCPQLTSLVLGGEIAFLGRSSRMGCSPLLDHATCKGKKPPHARTPFDKCDRDQGNI